MNVSLIIIGALPNRYIHWAPLLQIPTRNTQLGSPDIWQAPGQLIDGIPVEIMTQDLVIPAFRAQMHTRRTTYIT